MHERSLLTGLVVKLEQIAADNPDSRIAEVRIRLGEWTDFTPDHFTGHFRELARGTAAENARLDFLPGLPDHPLDVVLESVELE